MQRMTLILIFIVLKIKSTTSTTVTTVPCNEIVGVTDFLTFIFLTGSPHGPT